MKNFKKLLTHCLCVTFVSFSLYSCEPDHVAPDPDPTGGGQNPPPVGNPQETPFTSIPDALVGTWFASDNDKSLTIDWEEGTFQGQAGFKDFRTMVFTKDGKNAIEYSSEVYSSTPEKRYMFKRIGTLEFKENPRSLTFHVQSGTVRYYAAESTEYQEFDLVLEDWPTYFSVLLDPEATTYSSSTNYLTARRSNGAGNYSVKYTKLDGNVPDGGSVDPDDLYSQPPATGTYVEIAGKYYTTVTIGDLEWMSVNYAGTGGKTDSNKPHYGTFYKFRDLEEIPVPEGWRIPNKQDYINLLTTQGLSLNDWESTDGEDLTSKKQIGQLMATTGWLKEDGYENNASGFNAVPANYQLPDATPYGEGTNCYLWTAELDEYEAPVAFQIIQMPSDTYAGFTTFPVGYYAQHVPLRLVRDK